MLNRNLVSVSAAAVCLMAGQLLLAESLVLPDSTPIRVRLNRNLSSADARVGETVDFELLEDVKVNETIIAKRGGTVLATVTEAQEKRRMGRAGKLNVNIDHLRLVNGEKVALRAVKQGKGGSNAGKMTGAIVATSIVFFPAAPLFLFVKGKDITIPKGTEVTTYVNGDVTLDSSKFQVEHRDPAKPSQVGDSSGQEVAKALTNQDVLDLKAAGLGDEVVIAKIRSTRGNYRLDASDLVALKNAKVADSIIEAMIQVSKK